MNNKLNSLFIYNLGFGILFFFFGIFFLSTVFYFFDIRASVFSIYLSLILTLGYWFIKDKKGLLKYVFIALLLFIFSFYVSKYLIDLSGDGQSYHSMGVLQISLGWNPVKELIVPDIWDDNQALWFNHFPRFSWIVHGVIYKVIQNLEMSKVLNLMLIFSNFFIGFAYLKRKLKSGLWPLLIALLVAFNPVSVSEINTLCVDTLMASVAGILMWHFFTFWEGNKNNIFLDYEIIIALGIFLNIKSPSLGYVIIFFILFILVLLFKKKNLLKRFIKIGVLTSVLGIFVLSYDPYVVNFFNYKTPFYPIYFSGSKVNSNSISPRYNIENNIREFMASANSPYEFKDKSSLWKFYKSIFSESSNIHLLSYDDGSINKQQIRLKVPFWISKDELKVFRNSDVRVGGFGVWFSGAFVLSGLLLIYFLFKNKKEALKLLYIWALFLIITLVNPQSWWARYVPFLWFIPVLTAYWCLKEKNYLLRLGAKILIFVLLVNVLLIFLVLIPFQINVSQDRAAYSEEMKQINEESFLPVKIDLIKLGANRIYFLEKKVSFVETRVEINVMENYILKNLNNDEFFLIKNNYHKDDERFGYFLRDDVSSDDLVKLSNIFTKMRKMRFIVEEKYDGVLE
jgi:hypothetical protein